MQLDFAAILVLLAFVTGSIWVLDKLVLAPRRALARTGQGNGKASGIGEQVPEQSKLPWYVDISRSFFPIIVAVLVLRSFVVEPFRIPSGSMMPTLLPGDFILVNKFAFGIRLPVINTEIIDTGSPKRGDVAVFRYPLDPSVAYIKRIVGLPGDELEYRNKELYINDEPVPQSVISPARGIGDYEIRQEHLGNVNHSIQVRNGWSASGLWPELKPHMDSEGYITWKYKVPEGYYFAMGDNRDNSSDSRFWGLLPEQNLIGKAFLIWMNWDCLTLNGHCSRIGDIIQ